MDVTLDTSPAKQSLTRAGEAENETEVFPLVRTYKRGAPLHKQVKYALNKNAFLLSSIHQLLLLFDISAL